MTTPRLLRTESLILSSREPIRQTTPQQGANNWQPSGQGRPGKNSLKQMLRQCCRASPRKRLAAVIYYIFFPPNTCSVMLPHCFQAYQNLPVYCEATFSRVYRCYEDSSSFTSSNPFSTTSLFKLMAGLLLPVCSCRSVCQHCLFSS